jgi:hypothetical protein
MDCGISPIKTPQSLELGLTNKLRYRVREWVRTLGAICGEGQVVFGEDFGGLGLMAVKGAIGFLQNHALLSGLFSGNKP